MRLIYHVSFRIYIGSLLAKEMCQDKKQGCYANVIISMELSLKSLILF